MNRIKIQLLPTSRLDDGLIIQNSYLTEVHDEVKELESKIAGYDLKLMLARIVDLERRVRNIELS